VVAAGSEGFVGAVEGPHKSHLFPTSTRANSLFACSLNSLIHLGIFSKEERFVQS